MCFLGKFLAGARGTVADGGRAEDMEFLRPSWAWHRLAYVPIFTWGDVGASSCTALTLSGLWGYVGGVGVLPKK